ncbi:MAG: hypothetical protein L0Z50_03835 [Verrucomicrobiales bacterium]|nr:hypothetical protein [Verrucomicrobiales bacterium]
MGADESTGDASLLIDTTPGSVDGLRDAPITVGRTLTDATHAVIVRVTGKVGSGSDAYLDIQVGDGLTVSNGDSLDENGLMWTSGGQTKWVGQTVVSHDNTDAAATGSIGDGQESWIETTLSGPATLSFWWKISSEANKDFLGVEVDGLDPQAISGEVDWQQHTLSLGRGVHIIRWRYVKDVSGTSGWDRAWVDQVTFTSLLVYVDLHFAGPNPDGSLARPYPTFQQGYERVPEGGTVNIRAGTYVAETSIEKRLLLESYDGPVVPKKQFAGTFAAESDVRADSSALATASLTQQANGSFAIQFKCIPGQRYQIFSSTDLVTWELWHDFTPDEALVEFADTNGQSTPMRFFKIAGPMDLANTSAPVRRRK